MLADQSFEVKSQQGVENMRLMNKQKLTALLFPIYPSLGVYNCDSMGRRLMKPIPKRRQKPV